MLAYFHPPQSGYFMSYLNWTFHGSTTLAVPLACSRGASCDRPAAKGDPLWEWAASVSWPWPPWVLLPELEPGLESPPKPPIVLGQIFLLQKSIRLGMRLDFLQPHFLYQAILVRAVVSLHSPFRLRRIGCDDANPQALAHLTKLRHRHHPL